MLSSTDDGTSAIALPKAVALYETAKRTRMLHLSSLGLRAIPSDVWGIAANLIRLDLSYNLITNLPKAVSQMTSLQQLWLNDNPYLCELPPEMETCKKLQVLDLRRTGVRTLPREMGRLKQLIEVDLRDTPMALHLPTGGTAGGRLKSGGGGGGGASAGGRQSASPAGGTAAQRKHQVLDTDSLVAHLAEVDKRENLRLDMLEKITGGVYREQATSEEGQRLIPTFVALVCGEFGDLDELKNVVRNCDRLFPRFAHIAKLRQQPLRAKQLKARLVALMRDTAKVKMSAELELKLRAIYYDVIEPESVEGVIKSVYEGDWKVERPLELEDIQFLIKNAAALFPPNPEHITGPGIRSAVWGLQNDLIRQRQAVVDKLLHVLVNGLYPDREPQEVAQLAAEVGRLFERDRFATKKELEEMKKLAADAGQHFPDEFSVAMGNPAAIKASFKSAAAAAAASLAL